MGDLKPKKRKKKKKKSAFKTKSALEVARNPQPYEIPLYYPPFPSPLPKTKFNNSSKVANALRNYAAVSKAEINRLRGDLTAYRQEAQTVFRQKVAFPRSTVNVGDDDITGTDITNVGSVSADPDETSAGEETSADFDETSAGEETLIDLAGRGGERLTEPEDISGIEDFMKGIAAYELPETSVAEMSDFAPRATSSQRRKRRTNKSMKEIKAEMRRAGVGGYSKMNRQQLYEYAAESGIDISRQTISL